MVKEIEGIVSPPTIVWDRYTNNSLQTNNLGNIPDGEYRVVDEFICNFEKTYTPGGDNDWKEGDAPCQYIYSDTRVTVRSGMFDLGQLLQAANELKTKSHYWGVYLEIAKFVRRPRGSAPSEWNNCKDQNMPGATRRDGTVIPPSVIVRCKRNRYNEMTEEEKEMWAEGLIFIAWGS
tara:strand:- start:246 stop:776 length:531 start_codon:yes stop_codon:yes gene_type:complete